MTPHELANSNFKIVSSNFQSATDSFNNSEARIYDYCGIVATIIGGGLFSLNFSSFSNTNKLLLLLLIISLGTTVIIGLIGRLQLYLFWKTSRKLEHRELIIWREAEAIARYKTKEEAERAISSAFDKSEEIELQKLDSTKEYILIAQIFSAIFSVLLLVIFFFIK